MIIEFHTPDGVIKVNSESSTLDEKLEALGVTKEDFNKLLPKPVRDLAAEIDEIKTALKDRGIM